MHCPLFVKGTVEDETPREQEVKQHRPLAGQKVNAEVLFASHKFGKYVTPLKLNSCFTSIIWPLLSLFFADTCY